MSTKFCLVLLCTLSLHSLVEGQNQERMRVKYRIKSGGGKRVVDKAVAEVVAPTDEEATNVIQAEERQDKQIPVDPYSTLDQPSTDEVLSTVAGMGDELQEGLGEILGEYGDSVASIAKAIDRQSRSHNRSIGDIVFDVVKDVVAELVGGAMSRSFGIGTAREGGMNFLEIILSAINNAGEAKSC